MDLTDFFKMLCHPDVFAHLPVVLVTVAALLFPAQLMATTKTV